MNVIELICKMVDAGFITEQREADDLRSKIFTAEMKINKTLMEEFEIWSMKYQRFASLEGWGLFEYKGGIQLQRDDESEVFSTDEEAKIHVLLCSLKDSQMHSAAIAIVFLSALADV